MMKASRHLTVEGRYAEIRTICKFVAEGAAEAGLDENDVFHVELCCDEAATNIIEHAYRGENIGPIGVEYIINDQTLTITLSDDGRPFDPTTVPIPPSVNAASGNGESATDLAGQLQVGGLGLHLIRNLMDEVYYTTDPKHGNTMTMVKYLRHEEAG